MKRAAVVVAVAAIVGAVWYLQRPAKSKATPSDPPPAAEKRPRPITKVTKLASVEQRKLLADSIASAQAARAAATPPSSGAAAVRARPAPSLPAEGAGAKDMSKPETLKVEIRAAMKEVVPLLADCFDQDGAKLPSEIKVVAELTLTGDPDVGTVIDAHGIADGSGSPVLSSFDECLRNGLQLLALPPLAEGDRVEVHYPFLFAKQ
jgi:hypothetical protein